MVSSVLILALASAAAALKLTSPTSSDIWTVGEDQTVTWDAVSSDQDSFNIYLSNMASYPSTTILLASDVQSSAGSASVDGSKLTAGDSFTINFTNGTETEQIYAQSVSPGPRVRLGCEKGETEKERASARARERERGIGKKETVGEHPS